MTVFELKAILADIPDDYTVILATDDEGNGFKELEGYTNGHYNDHEYSDEQEISAVAANESNSEDEEEFANLPINCITLWP